MALKSLKHWGWGLLRSIGVGVGDGLGVAFSMAGANSMGLPIPQLSIKAFGVMAGWIAIRAFLKYLKDNPIPDIDDETKTTP